ncbi:MAG: hypothetical protein GVY15_00740 [Bacteroidetes bacterium]|jgi:hypothetical protein|nr:hypothetical protein [Bacteroidota bacterium]
MLPRSLSALLSLCVLSLLLCTACSEDEDRDPFQEARDAMEDLSYLAQMDGQYEGDRGQYWFSSQGRAYIHTYNGTVDTVAFDVLSSQPSQATLLRGEDTLQIYYTREGLRLEHPDGSREELEPAGK